MNYLLDTCVISELVARQPEPKVVNWIDAIEDERIYLNVITVGEIKRGIEKLPESSRRQALADWLDSDLLLRFRGRILAVDTAVMLRWGELVAKMEGAGRPLPAMDSLIAALALSHNLHLVTRNEKDFQGTGVVVVNPWAA
jgi:predicted nucleic acid-binding protein